MNIAPQLVSQPPFVHQLPPGGHCMRNWCDYHHGGGVELPPACQDVDCHKAPDCRGGMPELLRPDAGAGAAAHAAGLLATPAAAGPGDATAHGLS